MKILFRVNAGRGEGLGHLMRCIAIADAFRSQHDEIGFVCDDSPPALEILQVHKYTTTSLPTGKVDLLIVDGYLFTSEYLLSLKHSAHRICYIDDLIDRKLPVDVVIGNAYATRQMYHDKMSPQTMLLAGPEHIPLRKEFSKLSLRKNNEKISRILLTCGGEDPKNFTTKWIQALTNSREILSLDILIGAANRHSQSIEEAIKQSKHKCKLYKAVTSPLTLYREADVVITAASTTTWELCACGTPFIALQTADNQQRIFEYLQMKKIGLAISSEEEICQSLLSYKEQSVRQTQSHREMALIDGLGTTRIVKNLKSEI